MTFRESVVRFSQQLLPITAWDLVKPKLYTLQSSVFSSHARISANEDYSYKLD